MSTEFTKARVRTALGVTDAGLAKFFRVSTAAVAQWGDDDPIPELRQLQARQRRPDLFPAPQPDQVAPAARVG